ncbi:hypothetical protein [Nocardiopsis oceani]
MLPLRPHDPPALGSHRLHARLGEDACARVYLASAPGRPPAALKIVRSAYTSDPAFRGTFTHLVDSARGVRSTYVAPVVDADLRAATPWVAVGREPGPTLAELVRAHGPLPPAALHPLALALAQGLADLHAADRVHGSLWPDGVVLTRAHAVIADAGFEWAVAGIERRAPHPSFAPPEGGAAPATDVFAWAATLCFAASGVEGPGGLDRVPVQLSGLVDACLKSDPALRPDAADLVRMLGGPSVPAPWPPGLVAVVERHEGEARRFIASREGAGGTGRGGRGRTAALVAGGLALVLVIGAGAAWGLGWPVGGSGDGTDGSEEGAEGAEGAGLISGADCLDGNGSAEPADDIDDLDAMLLDFSPDGDVLAVTSHNHGLTLWDWREEEEIARPTEAVYGYGNPVFAQVGCTVAALDLVEHEQDGPPNALVTTYDLPSGTAAEHAGPQSERVEDGLESPRGGRLTDFSPSGASFAVVVEHESGLPSVGVVDTATGELDSVWDAATGDLVQGIGYLDEERVATADANTITVRDAGTGEPEEVIRDATSYHFAAVPGRSELVYVSNDHLIHWDFEEGTELGRFPVTEYHESHQEDAHITGLAADAGLGLLHLSWTVPSPQALDGATYRGSENSAYLWDLDSGEDLFAEDDAPAPRPVAFHPEGEAVAAVQEDGNVALLDPDSLEELRVLP